MSELQVFQKTSQERLRLAIRYTLLFVLEEEVHSLIEDLPVPRTRHGFRTQLFERYQRRMAEFDEAICKMFVKGVSAVEEGTVMEALTGIQPSARRFRGCFTRWKRSSQPGKPAP